jgi:hypothetical protein
MEEMMLKLNEFSHNHHPSRVKMLAKYIRRGISVDNMDSDGSLPLASASTVKKPGFYFVDLKHTALWSQKLALFREYPRKNLVFM